MNLLKDGYYNTISIEASGAYKKFIGLRQIFHVQNDHYTMQTISDVDGMPTNIRKGKIKRIKEQGPVLTVECHEETGEYIGHYKVTFTFLNECVAGLHTVDKAGDDIFAVIERM